MAYVVVDVFTAVKSATDRGTVGPGTVPGTQAGKGAIMLGSLVRGVGRLMAAAVPGEGEVGRGWGRRGWVSALALPHLGIPPSFPHVGSQFTTASGSLHTSHYRPRGQGGPGRDTLAQMAWAVGEYRHEGLWEPVTLQFNPVVLTTSPRSLASALTLGSRRVWPSGFSITHPRPACSLRGKEAVLCSGGWHPGGRSRTKGLPRPGPRRAGPWLHLGEGGLLGGE